MSSTKPHNRVFALVMALVFLVPVVISGIAVVAQIRQDRKDNDLKKQINTQLQAQQAANNPSTTPKKEGTLEGTQLQDFTPVQDVTQLQTIDQQVGTGEEVKPGATVTAHYTGAVAATGVIFQSSHDRGAPFDFSLSGGVIKGWIDGVPGMKVGGKRRLIIPADQAYGANPPGGSGIPANAPLVFDIEITGVKQ